MPRPDPIPLYTYDLLNHLTQVSMTRGSTIQTRTFVYDPTTQLLTSETRPEKGTTSYTYNSDGTLASRTDARNQKTTYTYDSYQRLTQIKRYNASGSEDVCQRSYFYFDTNPFDANFSQNGWGRQTAVAYLVPDSPTSCNGTGVQTVEMFSYTPAWPVLSKRLDIDIGSLQVVCDQNISGCKDILH
jgi:YD repeat-containing protein